MNVRGENILRPAFRAIFLVAVLLVSPLTTAFSATPSDRQVTVFAAASLKTALDAVVDEWETESGVHVRVSYGGSSALARQLAAGAPADIFISANEDWMDYVESEGLILAGSRADLLRNRLALIAHKDREYELSIAPGFPLAAALGDERLAMANTDAVPAGIYGKATLKSLKIWDDVSPRVVQTQDVRGALALVSRGEAPLGIVYRTDAVADPHVKIIGLFPEATHAPIVYPAALIKGARNPDARALLDYLQSARAAPAFRAQGFMVID